VELHTALQMRAHYPYQIMTPAVTAGGCD